MSRLESGVLHFSARFASQCAWLLVAGAIVTVGTQAQAALVYLDAVSGAGNNTTLGTGGTFTPPLNGVTGTDNNWEERTALGIAGEIFESGGEVAEDAPELRTTISGLTPGGSYKVYVHFWDGSGPNPDWSVRAGFASGTLTLYANGVDTDATDLGATPAGLASALSYVTNPTPFTEADRTQFAGLIGTTAANGSGQLNVFIDDRPSTIGANNRTWYEGVSYELVPEPTAALLMLFGVVAVSATRRSSR